MRKNSYCNRSEAGAETQAVLMSVFATLKQRDIPGTKVVVEAVREYIAMKNLPNLPKIRRQAAEWLRYLLFEFMYPVVAAPMSAAS